MKTFVIMTGPHSRPSRKGRVTMEWKVAIAQQAEGDGAPTPTGKTYCASSYYRAIHLACDMAHDRRLHLRVEALPFPAKSQAN